jgi:hypothetical protein
MSLRFKKNLGMPLTGLMALLFIPSLSSAASILNPSAAADQAQFYFDYQVTAPQSYYRIYLDTDNNASTGFPLEGIGADYLLEGANLFAYVGPGWNWKLLTTEIFNFNKNLVTQVIDRADVNPTGSLNCASSLPYVMQIQLGATIVSLPAATLSYPANSSCSNKISIAVPSYFYPDCATNPACYWGQLDAAIPTVGLSVINPNSGPGTSVDPNYVAQVTTTHSVGGTVIGYVYTSYGARSLADVESDVDAYYNWYNVDGIFFDEGYSADCSMLSYYEALNAYVKAKGGKGVTVVNYGTNTQECYITASDILVDTESTYSDYVTWQPATWTSGYPASHFWQIVYDTPQNQIQNVLTLAAQNNAGWIYITSLTLPNPYNALPSYWSQEVSLLRRSP